MQPLRCSRIVGSTAWMHRRVPHRLVFITAWNVSSAIASTSPETTIPALFTRMSTWPSVAITDAMPSATDASSSTSTISSDSGRSPAASSRLAPDASERTVAYTRHPSRARRSAVAKPIPVEQPVTIAICIGAPYPASREHGLGGALDRGRRLPRIGAPDDRVMDRRPARVLDLGKPYEWRVGDHRPVDRGAGDLEAARVGRVLGRDRGERTDVRAHAP